MFLVFKDFLLNFGFLFVFFVMLVIVGVVNVVNFIDGFDGLVIMLVMIVVVVFGIIVYFVGCLDFIEYLDVYYVEGIGEIMIFCVVLIGGGLGFLWYNVFFVVVFMGDIGLLVFGGVLGVIVVVIKYEIVLVIVGGLFVVEILSVII